MKAIVCEKFGSPEGLKLREVEKPTPQDNEVIVRVYAGTVSIGDVKIRGMTFPKSFIFGIFAKLMGFKHLRRKILGSELSGEIEAVGKDVVTFKKGDQVFGTTTGLRYGANAEYVCVPTEWKQGMMALKPINLSYEEAAAVPVGGMAALQILRKGNIKKGQKVLIYGASGSLGTFAVQLAKYFGAEVTGVCSTPNLEMVRSIGADSVIDYTKEDFAQSGETYDVIFDAVGKIKSKRCKGSLKEGGRFLSSWSLTSEENKDLIFLKGLVEAGKIKPVIDRRYPLEQTAEAHSYVETGHKKGNVVITVGHNNKT